MQYKEFLDTVKVIKMLYGATVARDVFEKNIEKYSKALGTDADFAKALLNRSRIAVQ